MDGDQKGDTDGIETDEREIAYYGDRRERNIRGDRRVVGDKRRGKGDGHPSPSFFVEGG